MITSQFHNTGEIGSTILAGLVSPKVQPDGHTGTTPRKAGADHLHSVIVEPKAIDRCPVFSQAKQAGFFIAGLRQGGRGPHFDKSEPSVG